MGGRVGGRVGGGDSGGDRGGAVGAGLDVQIATTDGGRWTSGSGALPIAVRRLSAGLCAPGAVLRRSPPTDCGSPRPASAIVPAASAELARVASAREPHPNAASGAPETLRPAARVGVTPEDTVDCGDTRLQLCPVRSSRGDLVMPPCWVNRGFISGLSERMGGLVILRRGSRTDRLPAGRTVRSVL